MDPSNLPVEHVPQNFWEFLHQDGGGVFLLVVILPMVLYGLYKLVVRGYFEL
jgi:hypothetical protein